MGVFISAVARMRIEAGLSSAELARKCGLYTSTIRNVELCKHRPTDLVVAKMAKELGVTLDALRQIIDRDIEAVKRGDQGVTNAGPAGVLIDPAPAVAARPERVWQFTGHFSDDDSQASA